MRRGLTECAVAQLCGCSANGLRHMFVGDALNVFRRWEHGGCLASHRPCGHSLVHGYQDTTIDNEITGTGKSETAAKMEDAARAAKPVCYCVRIRGRLVLG